VALTRAIIDRVDWPCEVKVNFAAGNMGCKQRIASGLSWAFGQVERAIILEDDCLPDLSFFRFSEALLDRYAQNERVMMISGDNFQFGRIRTPHSYYFSKYAHIWGWATWRRAWNKFDLAMRAWPEFRDSGALHAIAGGPKEARYWTRVLNRQYLGEIDTWDYSWQFSCWQHRGLTAIPKVNLVSNIGFGPAATRTGNSATCQANLPTESIEAIHHPPTVARDRAADVFTFENLFLDRRPVVVKWAAAINRFRRRLFQMQAKPAPTTKV
jgi:hypothetical protein